MHRPGADVVFARVEVDPGGAALSRMLHRRLEERAGEAAPTPLGEDLELLEVGLKRAG